MAEIKIHIEQNLKTGEGTIVIETPDFESAYSFGTLRSSAVRDHQTVDDGSWKKHIPDDEVHYYFDLADVEKR